MKRERQHIKNEFYLSQWVSGEITDADLKKLVSEDEFKAFLKLKKGLHVYSELEKPLEDSFVKIQNKIKKRSKSKIKTLNIKWVSSIAAMLIFFFGFYRLLGNDTVLSTADFGEQKTVALLDGSEVILNAKSAVNYSKKDWQTKREVYLTGEAYFKVKKGKVFTVKTKHGDITVLGTQFTVNSTKDYFEVICFEGKVKVTREGKSVVLFPAKSYRVVKDKVFNNISYKASQPTWILGESTYKSVPLYTVIIDLKNQFNLTIDSKNIDKNALFTGSFSHKNKDIALQSVFGAMNIKYIKKKGQLVLKTN